MKHVLKRKFLTACIVIFNIGFLVIVMDTNVTHGTHGNILFSLVSSLILILVFSLVYVAPFIIVIGIPTSIIIDRVIVTIKNKNFVSLILHIATGCIVAVIILSLLNSDMLTYEYLTNEFYLIKLMFICLYPGVNFWFADLVITKVIKNK
ncbi:hypothetical protein [Metasolibacillus meyeri]|uniref:hypothetical protein n=1 Tax=Metasolibacillus meyeri TaxID=1071052 RepID=UPI000D316CA8|nr:hypothetical protein [Metasolibacillus meyeri]